METLPPRSSMAKTGSIWMCMLRQRPFASDSDVQNRSELGGKTGSNAQADCEASEV